MIKAIKYAALKRGRVVFGLSSLILVDQVRSDLHIKHKELIEKEIIPDVKITITSDTASD